MSLEGPQLHYSRREDKESIDTLSRALRLAREVEELLSATAATAAPEPENDAHHDACRDAHTARMARAMAASLVDELEALVRGPRRSTPASVSGTRSANVA